MQKATNNPVVWVVQEGNNDYSPAEQFGEVRFITTADLTKFEHSQQNDKAESDLRKFLSHYVTGVDSIIPSGNPMVVAWVTMSLPVGNHNFLKWDGRRALYIPYSINPINFDRRTNRGH